MLLLRRYQTFITSPIAIVSLVLVGFATNSSALTYQSSTDVEFTLNPTLNVTLSSSDLTIDNLAPGSSSDSNVITASVSTNAGYGYYLSATAGTKTGSTDLTNGSGNSKFTNLSSTATTLNDIPADHWGYSYSQDDGTTWVSGNADSAVSGYNGLPLDNDDSGATGVMLIRTDSFSNAGSVKFKIGAKASTNQASGTYTNTVNFYAVANPEPTLGPVDCDPGKICYNVNSLTATEGTMGRQTKDDNNANITDNSTVTLLASNFSRQGYGFAGWSDTYDYSGNLYGPQETITTPTGTTANGLSLYAIWVKSEGSLQDSTKVAQVCNRLTAATPSTTKTLNSVSALTDERDGDTYAIAKLADGNCWMIENLRLDNSATLTIANTNNPLNDGTNVTIKHSYADANTYNTLSVSQDPTTNTWCNSSAASCDDQSMVFTGNTTNRASYEIEAAMTNDADIYSYGNYYNWYSATAGRGTYNFKTNNNSVTGDLCPAGWHLPTGGMAYASGSTSGINVTGNTSTFREFYKLSYKIMDEIKTAYEDTPNSGYSYYSTNTTNAAGKTAQQAFRSFPNNYLYSGFVGGDIWNNRGVQGLYWSSTTNSAGYAYRLLNSSLLVPSTGFNLKFNGGMVRCVASGV